MNPFTFTQIGPLLKRIDAEWQAHGFDEIEVAVHDDPFVHIKDAKMIRVHARVRTPSDLDSTLDGPLHRERRRAIHRALLRGEHEEMRRSIPPDIYPKAHALLTDGKPLPHSASVAGGIDIHEKHVYFLSTQTPDEVSAKLHEVASLFPRMLSQTSLDEHHAAVDVHDAIVLEDAGKQAWRVVYRRPL